MSTPSAMLLNVASPKKQRPASVTAKLGATVSRVESSIPMGIRPLSPRAREQLGVDTQKETQRWTTIYSNMNFSESPLADESPSGTLVKKMGFAPPSKVVNKAKAVKVTSRSFQLEEPIKSVPYSPVQDKMVSPRSQLPLGRSRTGQEVIDRLTVGHSFSPKEPSPRHRNSRAKGTPAWGVKTEVDPTGFYEGHQPASMASVGIGAQEGMRAPPAVHPSQIEPKVESTSPTSRAHSHGGPPASSSNHETPGRTSAPESGSQPGSSRATGTTGAQQRSADRTRSTGGECLPSGGPGDKEPSHHHGGQKTVKQQARGDSSQSNPSSPAGSKSHAGKPSALTADVPSQRVAAKPPETGDGDTRCHEKQEAHARSPGKCGATRPKAEQHSNKTSNEECGSRPGTVAGKGKGAGRQNFQADERPSASGLGAEHGGAKLAGPSSLDPANRPITKGDKAMPLARSRSGRHELSQWDSKDLHDYMEEVEKRIADAELRAIDAIAHGRDVERQLGIMLRAKEEMEKHAKAAAAQAAELAQRAATAEERAAELEERVVDLEQALGGLAEERDCVQEANEEACMELAETKAELDRRKKEGHSTERHHQRHIAELEHTLSRLQIELADRVLRENRYKAIEAFMDTQLEEALHKKRRKRTVKLMWTALWRTGSKNGDHSRRYSGASLRRRSSSLTHPSERKEVKARESHQQDS